jgi:MFS family permease
MMGGSLGNSLSPLFAALAILLAERLHSTGAAWASDLKTWQIAFFLVGAPGLIVALVFWLVVAEPARRQRIAAPAQGFPLAPLWQTLKAQRGAYGTLICAAVLNVTCIYASIGWMPTLFVRVHHWSPVKIGTTFSLINIPFALSGALAAGWTMSWLVRRGRRDAPLVMVLGHASALLLCGTAACLSPWPGLTLALNAVTAMTSTWSYAAALSGLTQITPNELRGQIAAIYTLCTGLFSMTVGSFVVGLLSDVAFRGPTGIAPSLASVFAVCAIGSICVALVGRRAYRRAEAGIH